MSKSLKEIQENTFKQVEALKSKQLNIKIQKNTIKQVKDISKTVHNLKREIEAIKKTNLRQSRDRKLGKRAGDKEISFTNRIQEIENLKFRRYNRRN